MFLGDFLEASRKFYKEGEKYLPSAILRHTCGGADKKLQEVFSRCLDTFSTSTEPKTSEVVNKEHIHAKIQDSLEIEGSGL